MKKLLLFILLICIEQVNAQVCFSPATNFVAGNNCISVINTDFNGDGIADLAVADYSYAGGITILLGTGTGSFGAGVYVLPGNSPHSITNADFNGDGKADLATPGGYPSNDVSILLGTGTGSFGTYTNFAVGYIPNSAITADFNGDGKTDLATANSGSNNVSVLLGTGTGSFGSAVNFATGTNPSSVISADFNGDGKADIVTGNFSSKDISVLLGTGTGSFSAAVNFPVGSGGLMGPISLCSEDFNGDGKLDLATVNDSSSNVVWVLLGTGTGNFGTAVNYTVGIHALSVISADFNGDGKKDLATANYNSSDISILLGTGTGSFGAVTNFTVGTNPQSVISADFNGDGKADLATANNNGGGVSVLLNCTPTPTCVASVTDSLFNIFPLNWGILPHYSPQVTSAIWYWGDGSSSNALYPGHTYTITGQYNICVTVYTSCGDSASACRNDSIYRVANNSSMINVNVVQNTNGINQVISVNNQITVYPNPTNGNFIIETNQNEKQTIQVLDLNGRIVFSQNIKGTTNIDAGNLNEGIYNLTIKTIDRVVNKKLVIVR